MLAGLLGQATAGRGSRENARRLGCENVILRRRSLPTLSHGQDPLVTLKHRLDQRTFRDEAEQNVGRAGERQK